MKKVLSFYTKAAVILRIAVGLIIGVVLGLFGFSQMADAGQRASLLKAQNLGSFDPRFFFTVLPNPQCNPRT